MVTEKALDRNSAIRRVRQVSLIRILVGEIINEIGIRSGSKTEKVRSPLKTIPLIDEVRIAKMVEKLKKVEEGEEKRKKEYIQKNLKGFIEKHEFYYLFEIANIIKYGWTMQIAKIEKLNEEIKRQIIMKKQGIINPLEKRKIEYNEPYFSTYMGILAWYLKWQTNFLV